MSSTRLTETPAWLRLKQGRSASARSQAAQPSERELGRRIWAVGGGKGGIGKTFLAANLATVAARMGCSVLLVDLDLGGANLHTCLLSRPGPGAQGPPTATRGGR